MAKTYCPWVKYNLHVKNICIREMINMYLATVHMYMADVGRHMDN